MGNRRHVRFGVVVGMLMFICGCSSSYTPNVAVTPTITLSYSVADCNTNNKPDKLELLLASEGPIEDRKWSTPYAPLINATANTSGQTHFWACSLTVAPEMITGRTYVYIVTNTDRVVLWQSDEVIYTGETEFNLNMGEGG